MTPISSEEARKFSIDSDRNGLLGRVIENWLTSVNERQYQLPFCQVLAAEGETILYISSHGPYEKGKDIITRTADGEIRAYQLKAGDVAISEWRKIHGEIVNLVELPIELPGEEPICEFVPFLVTNGKVTDPVLEQIRSENVGWAKRGIDKKLRTIQKGEMFDRFRTSHGAYLPQQLTDFRTFLELVLRGGKEPADKDKAGALIEHILPVELEKQNALDMMRAATSIALLTAYISGPATLESNHWAVFEYWVMAGAYTLRLMELSAKAEHTCKPTFDICRRAAREALSALADECEQRSHFVEGAPLVDGHTYGSRITILVGLLCALELSDQIDNKNSARRDFVWSFYFRRLKQASMWGESAAPFLYVGALFAEHCCRQNVGEGVVIQIIREIIAANGDGQKKGRGVPNVYYTPEAALRLQNDLDRLNLESFVGFSYVVESLIQFLARRWRRQAIASLWPAVTHIAFQSYLPGSPGEWYRWQSSEGVLESRLPGQPESWESLRTWSETIQISDLPNSLVKHPAFAIYFVLVYPHRFTPQMAKLIEDALTS